MLPLAQQQSSVSCESTCLQCLTVILVAPLWVCADDVISRVTTPSVTQAARVSCRKAILSVQEDVVSPVFVQVPPQVAHCF